METNNNDIKDLKIKKLISNLGSDSGLVRQKAREEMVKLGQNVIDYLMELLSHPKHIYRWEAVKTLEEIEDPLAIPLLIQSLEDDNEDVRWIAAKGLVKLGKKSILPLLKVLEEKSDSVFILEGAHHVFSDLRENNELPEGFPIDKILTALKNPEWVISVKPLIYQTISDLDT